MSELDYVLVDLDAVRAARLIERAIADDRRTVNTDEVTSFTWITLDELEDADAVLDMDLGGQTPVTSGPWWVCRCGRKLYEHAGRTVPGTGGREYVCSFNRSGRFEPADRTLEYGPEIGLWRKERA